MQCSLDRKRSRQSRLAARAIPSSGICVGISKNVSGFRPELSQFVISSSFFPFITLPEAWIGDRTCVAPYFEAYDGQADKDSKDVKHVVADFMEYKPKKTFDLLLCNQVIEHVQDPAAFMKKLIESATISIISAPYNWPSCGKNCGHVTDNITPSMFAEWSSPYKPVISEVIMEGKGAVYEKRFLWVFDRTNDISRR